jgi:regulator of protease activity HflC (stomatin/prohibitin superfamily)
MELVLSLLVLLFIVFLFSIIRLIIIKENEVAIVIKNGKLKEVLSSGLYIRLGTKLNFEVIKFIRTLQNFLITNQEIMTKDQISLRVSASIFFKIENLEVLYKQLGPDYVKLLYGKVQIPIRMLISKYYAEELIEKQDEINEKLEVSITEQLERYGVTIDSATMKDFSFPKKVQEIMNQKLEARYAAQAKLEKARGEVAANRALKNAAKILKDNPEIKFLIKMDALEKSSTLNLVQEQ